MRGYNEKVTVSCQSCSCQRWITWISSWERANKPQIKESRKELAYSFTRSWKLRKDKLFKTRRENMTTKNNMQLWTKFFYYRECQRDKWGLWHVMWESAVTQCLLPNTEGHTGHAGKVPVCRKLSIQRGCSLKLAAYSETVGKRSFIIGVFSTFF